jgi:PAS domain S-box-containing protein
MKPTDSPDREGEESALRNAFEDAPFEFWLRDSDDRCVAQNVAARKWGEMRGLRTDESPVSAETLAVWQENNRRAWAGELVQNEFEIARDGERRQFQCIILPVRAGGRVRSIVGLNIDITDRKRAEEKLRESEHRLHEALRIGRMGCFAWDLVTNELRWTPELYSLFGCAPDGRFAPTIDGTIAMVPPEERAFVQARLAAVIAGTGPYESFHRIVRPDGRVIHVQTRGEVIRDAAGRALQMLGTVMDVTGRIEAEEALRASEDRLKRALRAASAGIWEVDLSTGAVLWAPETYDLYGVEPGLFQPTFAAWRARLHPDDLPAVDAAIEDALRGRTDDYRAEFRALRGGTERWLLAIGQVRRAPDGRPLRMSGVTIDITSRKRTEEELRQVDRRRSDFLGVLSHELRNPLAPIRNGLYILHHAAPGGDQAQRALTVIERQVAHLARLVDDLLDVARISSGKIRLILTRLDLVDLVRRTVDDHRTLFAARKLDLTAPAGPVWIQGDGTRLAQVLGNLLSNAAKFTSEGGRVAVSLRTMGARAVLEVADDGVGMDEETLKRLFVPFAQAACNLDRSRGGRGLGLALVKNLAELHGGEVSASSDGPGRGACLTIQLPLEDSEPRT